MQYPWRRLWDGQSEPMDGWRELRYLHENMDMRLTWCKVRGIDMMTPIRATMIEKTAVHNEWSERVFRTLAPVKT